MRTGRKRRGVSWSSPGQELAGPGGPCGSASPPGAGLRAQVSRPPRGPSRRLAGRHPGEAAAGHLSGLGDHDDRRHEPVGVVRAGEQRREVVAVDLPPKTCPSCSSPSPSTTKVGSARPAPPRRGPSRSQRPWRAPGPASRCPRRSRVRTDRRAPGGRAGLGSGAAPTAGRPRARPGWRSGPSRRVPWRARPFRAPRAAAKDRARAGRGSPPESRSPRSRPRASRAAPRRGRPGCPGGRARKAPATPLGRAPSPRPGGRVGARRRRQGRGRAPWDQLRRGGGVGERAGASGQRQNCFCHGPYHDRGRNVARSTDRIDRRSAARPRWTGGRRPAGGDVRRAGRAFRSAYRDVLSPGRRPAEGASREGSDLPRGARCIHLAAPAAPSRARFV